MKPLFQQKVAANRDIRPLFQPLQSDEQLLSELSSDKQIQETLQTFRDDDLIYSSFKVSDSEKDLISELKRSLQEDEDVDYLKVCSAVIICFLPFL